jgi:hypothetical protein
MMRERVGANDDSKLLCLHAWVDQENSSEMSKSGKIPVI